MAIETRYLCATGHDAHGNCDHLRTEVADDALEFANEVLRRAGVGVSQ